MNVEHIWVILAQCYAVAQFYLSLGKNYKLVIKEHHFTTSCIIWCIIHVCCTNSVQKDTFEILTLCRNNKHDYKQLWGTWQSVRIYSIVYVLVLPLMWLTNTLTKTGRLQTSSFRLKLLNNLGGGGGGGGGCMHIYPLLKQWSISTKTIWHEFLWEHCYFTGSMALRFRLVHSSVSLVSWLLVSAEFLLSFSHCHQQTQHALFLSPRQPELLQQLISSQSTLSPLSLQPSLEWKTFSIMSRLLFTVILLCVCRSPSAPAYRLTTMALRWWMTTPANHQPP